MTLYRLYIDESGDHTYKEVETPDKRYLALFGCIIEKQNYIENFYPKLESLKKKYFDYHPDDPIIFHRQELINKKGCFWRLRDPKVRENFEKDISRF